MNESEFADMVKSVREAESAIGIVDYNLTDKQIKGREFCRSLYVVKDIQAGELITEENVRSIRPGFGAHPKYFSQIRGSAAKRNFERGERFNLDY
jgi:pseudaminic acid synthase